MKSRFVIPAGLGVLLLLLAPGGAAGQTLLTETTWGGVGAEFIGDVATAADGSAYAVGTTDSFAVDQFGTPSPRIFIVKLRQLPHCTDPIKALRSALKVLLRRFGLRCIEVHETTDKKD